MKHPGNVDAARAALYALGALPADQIAAFEERLAASPALRAEVDALRAPAAELALAATPVAPRPELRERLLGRVRAEAGAPAPRPALPDLMFALAEDSSWIRIAPGLEHRALSQSSSGASYLLRLAPGATIPPHPHRRVEHTFVLSGSVEVSGTLCHAGDYHRAAAGTSHAGSLSVEGCVVLVMEASEASA